jgi:membrane protease YdiL (CAAX protease family)
MAIAGSSVLYALVHLKTPMLTAAAAYELTGLLLFGGLLSLCYLVTKQLYLSIGLHASLAYGVRVNKLLVEFPDASLAWLTGTSRLVNGLSSWILLLVVAVGVAWWGRTVHPAPRSWGGAHRVGR